jgi:hypothetical protein
MHRILGDIQVESAVSHTVKFIGRTKLRHRNQRQYHSVLRLTPQNRWGMG